LDKKLIILRYQDKILTALFEDDRVVELHFDEEQRDSLLGNIYIGRVQKIVKNINAAFIEIEDGIQCYYSLSDNKAPIYIKKGSSVNMQAGDEVVVQVCRENLKSKPPAVTSNINFTGNYVPLPRFMYGCYALFNRCRSYRSSYKSHCSRTSRGVRRKFCTDTFFLFLGTVIGSSFNYVSTENTRRNLVEINSVVVGNTSPCKRNYISENACFSATARKEKRNDHEETVVCCTGTDASRIHGSDGQR